MLSEFRYITFDCFGTLVDWKSGIRPALERALGEHHATGADLADLYVSTEMEEERTYKTYREVLADTAVKLAGSLGTTMERSTAKEFANSLPSWPPFEDAAATLKELGTLGYKRYILSNVDSDLLEQTISRDGFEVDGFVTADQIHSYKPRAAHWLRFMQETGAREEEILHVAQSVYHDITAASALGISTAWIDRYRERLPGGVQPSYICGSLSDLLALLVEDLRTPHYSGGSSE